MISALHRGYSLVEGLLPYLLEKDVHILLDRCAGLAVAGSILVADLAGEGFLSSIWLQPMLNELVKLGAPWRFGTDNPEELFIAHGWNAIATRPGEAGASYDRWPFPVAPRDTPGVPQSFFVTANRE